MSSRSKTLLMDRYSIVYLDIPQHYDQWKFSTVRMLSFYKHFLFAFKNVNSGKDFDAEVE